MHWPYLSPAGRSTAPWVHATDSCGSCVIVVAQQPSHTALQERRQVHMKMQSSSSYYH